MYLYPGSSVELADGASGEIVDIVVDRRSRRASHLVLSPSGAPGTRLVPLDALEPGPGPARLSWSTADVMRSPQVEEIDFLGPGSWPATTDGWTVGEIHTLAYPDEPSMWPDYTGRGIGYGVLGPRSDGRPTVATAFHRIPAGSAELRRASIVLSSDHHLVGHVKALVTDVGYAITHVVVDHGHLWTHREVTIPVTDIASVATDTVRLRVARDVTETYPPARYHRHHDVFRRTDAAAAGGRRSR
jgi:hypothetical protein